MDVADRTPGAVPLFGRRFAAKIHTRSYRRSESELPASVRSGRHSRSTPGEIPRKKGRIRVWKTECGCHDRRHPTTTVGARSSRCRANDPYSDLGPVARTFRWETSIRDPHTVAVWRFTDTGRRPRHDGHSRGALSWRFTPSVARYQQDRPRSCLPTLQTTLGHPHSEFRILAGSQAECGSLMTVTRSRLAMLHATRAVARSVDERTQEQAPATWLHP